MVRRQLYLPLLTYPDAASETLLGNAVELAKNLDAVLCATVVYVTIPPISNPWPVFLDTDQMVLRAERMSHQEGEALTRAMKKRCAEENVTLDIRSVTASQPEVVDVITEEARLFDMTLAYSATELAPLLESLIFGAGRPVILYPGRPCSGRIGRVAIAWDGGRAAARAVADADGFIERAEAVSVIVVQDEKPIDKASAERLVAILQSRSKTADIQIVDGQNGEIGGVIQAKAVELGADLLVMGGYGHSRLREFVLGGATSTVLPGAILPVLMSH